MQTETNISNKDIIIELIWFFAAFITAFIIGILILPSPDFYVNDIFIGMNKLTNNLNNGASSNSLIAKASSTITQAFALVLVFPILFLLSFLRASIKLFKNRFINLLLLFYCIFSIFITALLLRTYEAIATLLSGSWTLFPQLSALPETISGKYISIWQYAILSFLSLQIIVLLITIRQIFFQKTFQSQEKHE